MQALPSCLSVASFQRHQASILVRHAGQSEAGSGLRPWATRLQQALSKVHLISAAGNSLHGTCMAMICVQRTSSEVTYVRHFFLKHNDSACNRNPIPPLSHHSSCRLSCSLLMPLYSCMQQAKAVGWRHDWKTRRIWSALETTPLKSCHQDQAWATA
eukprot:scaffold191848_cov22-Tisochrysis_lutea.AAC.1